MNVLVLVHCRYLHDQCPSSEQFFAMLRHYVHGLYHGKLVHSTDFLRLYFDTFKGSVSSELREVCNVWLNNSGIPKHLSDVFDKEEKSDCAMFRVVKAEVSKWIELNKIFLKRKRKRTKTKTPMDFRTDLVPEQIVLLLEYLLEEPVLHSNTAKTLLQVFDLSNFPNADVAHRWCEVVVKSQYADALEDVRYFLQEHQAMGIYLYGELVMSTSTKFQRLANEMFDMLRTEMDDDLARNVAEML